jgi:hypothetical protein
MLDLKETPIKVWDQRIHPELILKWTTVFNLGAYFIFIVYAFIVFEDETENLPSMSGMIAYSKGTTISFTIIVFIHGYTIMSYLVIASEYVGFRSNQFKFISVSSFLYWVSLIMISYLPLDAAKHPHNIFAITGFIFSIFTVYLHKHTFLITEFGKWPRFNFYTTEKYLMLIEVSMIIIISILGILYWSLDIVVAEYVFVALILLDKYLKVYILEQSGLMNIDNAYLEYRYFSPPNNPATGIEIYNPDF